MIGYLLDDSATKTCKFRPIVEQNQRSSIQVKLMVFDKTVNSEFYNSVKFNYEIKLPGKKQRKDSTEKILIDLLFFLCSENRHFTAAQTVFNTNIDL